MSFENIQLPGFLLADLYKDCLIELDNIQPNAADSLSPVAAHTANKEALTIENGLKFLGENKQQVTVLIHDEEAIYLNESDLTFLTNVLKACQLNLGDIAIVNTVNQPVDYSLLVEELAPQFVLLFGLETTAIKLPFSIPDFQPQPYAGVTYLKAPPLKIINLTSQEARVLKSNLWINLQKIFSINS